MTRPVIGLGLACLIGLGLSAPNSPAWAQTNAAESSAPSSAQIDALIQDIKAHKQMCDNIVASQPVQFQQCANEKATLIARQQRLGMSNDAVTNRLNGSAGTRGWRDAPTSDSSAPRSRWP